MKIIDIEEDEDVLEIILYAQYPDKIIELKFLDK